MGKFKFECHRCDHDWVGTYPLAPCPKCNSKDERELVKQLERSEEEKKQERRQRDSEVSGLPIDEMSHYLPMHKLPVYMKITRDDEKEYKTFSKYDIRIEDKERQEEKGGEGKHNYLHEAYLIGKEKVEYGTIPAYVYALAGHSSNPEEAHRRIRDEVGNVEQDEEVLVLTYIRVDKAKDFVLDDQDAIPSGFSKEDAEGNG